jgi:hypothetical protein
MLYIFYRDLYSVKGIEREHKKNSILVLRGLFWGGDIVRL